MMLLILTVERYVSVCHPSFTRPVMGPPGYASIIFLLSYIHKYLGVQISHYRFF